MTGLDRLRGYARRMDELHVWPGGARLREIAGQIELEHDAEVADSPYDAILPEDREAAAWVRDHGGLDHVKAEWRSRVPYDKYEQRRQRLLGHIAECEAALGRRNARIEELGHRVSDLTSENAELRKRAMPEGMEWLLEVWPRWSNGEYCKFGDWWTADRYGDNEPRQLRRLVIFTPELLDEWGQGDGESYSYEWDFMRPSELGYRPDKVEPPSPPVIAADGKPLREGEHVWHVKTGAELVVKSLPKPGEYQTVVVIAQPANYITSFDPDQLTHERPERKCRDCAHWQKDPTTTTLGVCWELYDEYEGEDCYPARSKNHVACKEFMRRAKKLAERGE